MCDGVRLLFCLTGWSVIWEIGQGAEIMDSDPLPERRIIEKLNGRDGRSDGKDKSFKTEKLYGKSTER